MNAKRVVGRHENHFDLVNKPWAVTIMTLCFDSVFVFAILAAEIYHELASFSHMFEAIVKSKKSVKCTIKEADCTLSLLINYQLSVEWVRLQALIGKVAFNDSIKECCYSSTTLMLMSRNNQLSLHNSSGTGRLRLCNIDVKSFDQNFTQ